MTKQHFFSFIVALFATVSSVFCQTKSSQTYLTANKNTIIIDDRVLGLVSDVRCQRTSETIVLQPFSGAMYSVTVQNPAKSIFFKVGVRFTDDKFWKLFYQYGGVMYEEDPSYSFIYKSEALFQPEVDPNGMLTLTGKNGTILDAAAVGNGVTGVDPCAWVNVYPNPTDGDIYVDMDLDIARVAKITVYDNFGNISQQISDISLSVGRNTQRIDLSAARAGLYRVVVEAGDRRQIIPVQKN
jgi:hypothetical protein